RLVSEEINSLNLLVAIVLPIDGLVKRNVCPQRNVLRELNGTYAASQARLYLVPNPPLSIRTEVRADFWIELLGRLQQANPAGLVQIVGKMGKPQNFRRTMLRISGS